MVGSLSKLWVGLERSETEKPNRTVLESPLLVEFPHGEAHGNLRRLGWGFLFGSGGAGGVRLDLPSGVLKLRHPPHSAATVLIFGFLEALTCVSFRESNYKYMAAFQIWMKHKTEKQEKYSLLLWTAGFRECAFLRGKVLSAPRLYTDPDSFFMIQSTCVS